jgi:hypothetical protein
LVDGVAAVLTAAVVAWLGYYLHNVNDLPGQTLVSPETLYPTLVMVVLVTLWAWRPNRPTTWALWTWTALNMFLGGVVSVLPLPVLPFDPAQTAKHYAFHAVYTLTQVPLFVLLTRRLRSATARPAPGQPPGPGGEAGPVS